jgi:hypothetical protein
MCSRIYKTWFRIKFSLTSSPNDGYTLGLVDLLKRKKKDESIWKMGLTLTKALLIFKEISIFFCTMDMF